LLERELAELLVKCREMSGLSQELIADLLHIERSSISKFESGKRIPNGIIIKSWGEVTNCQDLISTYFSGKESWKQLLLYKMAFGQVKYGLEMAEMNVI
jgi:transcriptional regulator with XRE-family HTH domain